MPALVLASQPVAAQSTAAPSHSAAPGETAGRAEVVVHQTRAARPPTELGLTAREAARSAGTQGDAVKALQSLPGSARAGVQAEPILWGSAPRETGILVDDVPIPFLYHGSGIRSVVPAPWLATLRLVPGAYDVKYGRQLGGLIRLGSSDADTLEPELELAADLLDVSALAGAPLSPRAALRVGARFGYLAEWLPRLIDDQIDALYAIPQYWDAQAQALLSLRQGAELKLQLLTASDSELRRAPGAGSTRATELRTRRSFTRLYAVHEQRRPASRTRFIPYIGFATDQQQGLSSGVATKLERAEQLAGFRIDHAFTVGSGSELRAGFDAQLEKTDGERRGSLSVPAREGDLQLFGQAPGRDYVVDPIRVFRVGVAPYLAADFAWGPWSFVPGARLETSWSETQRGRPSVGGLPDTGSARLDMRLAPRLAVEWRLDGRARLFAALSRHHQPADVLDLGALTGNPALPAASATHVAAGEQLELSRRVEVQLTVFHKWLAGLATRSAASSPPPGRVLAASGTGRVFGGQLLLRVRELAGFAGSLSASLSRSTRRDHPAAAERPFDYDQPLSLTALLGKEVAPWTLSVRSSLASGFPRPAVVAADYDLQADRYEPVLDRSRWSRLPAYFALDLRVERRFVWSSGGELVAYVELLNVTQRRNAEEVVYSADYRQRAYLSGLPALALAGVRFRR